MSIEEELKQAKVTLEKESYELRWGGYLNPYDYVRSAQFAVVSYWKRKVEELENNLKNNI